MYFIIFRLRDPNKSIRSYIFSTPCNIGIFFPKTPYILIFIHIETSIHGQLITFHIHTIFAFLAKNNIRKYFSTIKIHDTISFRYIKILIDANAGHEKLNLILRRFVSLKNFWKWILHTAPTYTQFQYREQSRAQRRVNVVLIFLPRKLGSSGRQTFQGIPWNSSGRTRNQKWVTGAIVGWGDRLLMRFVVSVKSSGKRKIGIVYCHCCHSMILGRSWIFLRWVYKWLFERLSDHIWISFLSEIIWYIFYGWRNKRKIGTVFMTSVMF